MIELSHSAVQFLRRSALLFGTAFVLVAGGCNRADRSTAESEAPGSLLEPPTHAPGEPHSFIECPDGACPREQPAYLFSGEFHETVVDLRVANCGGGLDLVWARRYRSRVVLPAGQTPIGNNWDHSYNIYVMLPEDGDADSAITIYDGNARPAVFVRDQASGLYSSPGYHREGAFDQHGRFELRFADGGKWVFKSAAESAAPEIRRLAHIIDRNGNIVRLDYDDGDRLQRVVSSTGQSLELEYDATDHITTVTAKLDEQTQRRVVYERYQTGDAGGNPFDLARVTLPPVVGTVTGNDFPEGTTTTYTYSTGFDDPDLDGNLLTITDGLGRVYLRNSYASTVDPGDFEFDHLVRQVWGDEDDAFAITYTPVSPTEENGHAIRKAWLNDRVGRVSEHYFDVNNQLVLLREYTGFAEPGQPSDAFNNRPTKKLRFNDPAYFETRYAYNADGHRIWEMHPRGNVTRSVYEGDLNPQASPRIRGNLREVHHEAGSCGDGLATISEHYEYAEGLGNEHGERDFVVRAVDARGHVTLATYDEAGNRTAVVYPEPKVREDMEYDVAGRLTRRLFPEDQHGHRREIVHVYEHDERRQTTIVDPQGLALTTVKEFDAACNETRRVDPRGLDYIYIYNQRDQLIRELSPHETCVHACGGGVPARSYTDRHYDANGNLVRVDYEARNCDGTLQAEPVISTYYEYDILNELTATRQELGDGSELVNQFELDANREQVLLRYGEAASGADPFNTLTIVYDERGLPFREIRGAGSESAATTQHDYDVNGNEIATHVGLEGPVQSTASSFDCADRLVATNDPMGNRTEFDYDPAGNVIEQRLFGELVDVPGAAQNVLLERERAEYDAMNRRTVLVRDHFDPVTQTPIGNGHSKATLVYDGESRVVRDIDANGNQTSYEFDAAGRRSKTVDPAGNITELSYDAAGNVTTQVQTDVASDGSEPQVRVWLNTYDASSNLVASTDPLGNTTFTCYDSLGLANAEVDERGNRILHRYDGAGRLLETRYVLTDDGTGAGTVVGAAVVRQLWDDSDRLVAREDPNGNVTQYAYDPLNRLVIETFADGSEVRSSYDVHDNVLVRRDANGTKLTHIYDALNRIIEIEVDPGPTVSADTSLEIFAYDGRGLLVAAGDDDTDVARSYDSLGAILSETQTLMLPQQPPAARTITYVRDGLGNPVVTIYPSGRRITRSYDGLQRTQLISEDGQPVVSFDYLGPDLLGKHVLPVGLDSEYAYDLGRRMASSRHTIGDEILDAREYEYDEAGNKRLDRELSPDGVTGNRQIEHDSLGRSVSIEIDESLATDSAVAYAFDAAGNRTLVSGDLWCSGAYTQAGRNALVHQYSSTSCEDWSHDTAGNLRETTAAAPAGRNRKFSYDHRNRLVGIDLEDAALSIRFAYDAFGRKVQTWANQGPSNDVRYVYDDWNIIEEYAPPAPDVAASYLYIDGLDERLEIRRAGASWWYLDDELGSTVAIVHRSEDEQLMVERYAYRDYGEPLILVDNQLHFVSMAGNAYLFAGARWLPEARLYDFRTRHFDPVAGRFISRDRIGVWGDEENLGNGYTYVGNMPDTHTDPTGEHKKPYVTNCHARAMKDIDDVLGFSESIARQARQWFNQQAKRKRMKRKRDWTKNRNDGRKWWGKYYDVRFHRIKWNFRKIVRRCSKNVVAFRCRTTGNICGRKKASAWTHSFWHAQIRLCKFDGGGFFKANGDLGQEPDEMGDVIMHEIAHNINAIGDKKIGKKKMYSITEAQRLAKERPIDASWNAANYDTFADER